MDAAFGLNLLALDQRGLASQSLLDAGFRAPLAMELTFDAELFATALDANSQQEAIDRAFGSDADTNGG